MTTIRSPVLGLVTMRAVWQHAEAAAEDQRIGGVTWVIQHRAVDGRDAHLVAVVFDAVNHAFGDAARVQHARRQRFSPAYRAGQSTARRCWQSVGR